MTDYVHGYGTREQERLVEQAEHWRHRLITNGTALEPGTRLLEVGCGVGAVLAVLGQEFPRITLHGVDIEPKQLAFARGHLERAGVEATLVEADARALPFADQSFDHVWMMWFLEHVADPPEVLREARRVLVPGGAITAIEVDYATCRADPSTPALEALFRAMVQGMAASGWSDAAGFVSAHAALRASPPIERRGARALTPTSDCRSLRLEAHARGRTPKPRAETTTVLARFPCRTGNTYMLYRAQRSQGWASSSQILSVNLGRAFKGRKPHG